MKRRMLIILMSFICLPMCCYAAIHNEIKPLLFLHHINVIKASERDGDEVYFDVSVYRSNHAEQYFRIPEKPFHWVSQLVGKLSQVKLWSEPIKEGETVVIIVSLIETDASFIEPDDLIGVMRIKLKNEHGVLQARWTMPNHLEGPVTVPTDHNDIQKFDLRGEGSDYEVFLSIEK